MEVDGIPQDVAVGSLVEVKENFLVKPETDDYRVNIIGWTKKGIKNEAWQKISKGSIAKRFSVDKNGELFRVEVYSEEKFSGMILVRFTEEVADSKPKPDAPQALQPAQPISLAALSR